MSTKIENVVYRASWRDEISANFESVSFSTATRSCTNKTLRLSVCPDQLSVSQTLPVWLGGLFGIILVGTVGHQMSQLMRHPVP
jgi:hypothetical protein